MKKVKKFLNSKAGVFLKSIATGALAGVSSPITGILGGVVNSLKGEVLKNIDSPVNEGSFDYVRLVTFVFVLVALVFAAYELFTGAITFEDFMSIFEEINKEIG